MLSSLKKTFVLLVVFQSIVNGEFNLTLLHVNDIHVRFEETDSYSGTCKKTGTKSRWLRCYHAGFLPQQLAIEPPRG